MFNQNPKPIDPEAMSTTSSTDAMITKKQSTWEQLQSSLGGKYHSGYSQFFQVFNSFCLENLKIFG